MCWAASRQTRFRAKYEVMPEVIGLFLRTLDNAYQRQLKAAGIREAKRRGFELLIQSVQFDASQQVAQIREAIKNARAIGMIAVLVSGVRDADLVPVAHEAPEAGLEWAVLNDAAFLDDVRQSHPSRAIFSAAGDQTEIGRVQAQQIRVLLRPPGRVMCVTGNIRNIEAHLRLEGLKQGLEGDFEVATVNADWTSEGARRAIESWVTEIAEQADVPAAFVAQNDEMALGVRQALRDIDTRRDWPIGGHPVVGCDGAEDFGQRLVRQGRLKATVVMTPGSGPAIEWVARARSGGELPPAHVVLPVTSFPALPRLRP
jgi:ribose transport system substrate-binding protein